MDKQYEEFVGFKYFGTVGSEKQSEPCYKKHVHSKQAIKIKTIMISTLKLKYTKLS